MTDTPSPFVTGMDALMGRRLLVTPKAYLRGIVRDDIPQVGLVVKSDEGDVMAVIGLNAQDAHILSERLRQEAELVSVIEEDNSK